MTQCNVVMKTFQGRLRSQISLGLSPPLVASQFVMQTSSLTFLSFYFMDIIALSIPKDYLRRIERECKLISPRSSTQSIFNNC